LGLTIIRFCPVETFWAFDLGLLAPPPDQSLRSSIKTLTTQSSNRKGPSQGLKLLEEFTTFSPF